MPAIYVTHLATSNSLFYRLCH